MKNKLLIIALSLVLMLGLVACSNKTTNNSIESQESEKLETETMGEAEDTEDQSKEHGSDVEADIEEQKSSVLDSTLTGLTLLNTITMETPDYYMTKSETVNMQGFISTVVTYTKGESTRMETESEDGKSIIIYNADEGATYQYVEGETTGVVFMDDMDSDMDMSMDVEAPTFGDLTGLSDENIIARVEDLDGEEVVFFEITTNEEGMTVKINMWHSVKLGITLKYEMYMNDTIVVKSVVTDYDVKSKIDNSMFEKPAGIEFSDFTMDFSSPES